MLNYEDRVDELIAMAVRAGKADRRNIVPMSPNEVQALEGGQSSPLPGAYRAFLVRAGRAFGQIGIGDDMFYPDIIDLRTDVQELLNVNRIDHQLGDSETPFFMHEGYKALWLKGPGDDPPVFGYSEGFMGVFREERSFTDWLARMIQYS
jgi:hypothetical protein